MMGQLAEMRGYRPARWRDIDAAQAEREITPDPHINPFVGMPQEINRTANPVPDAVGDALRWDSLSSALTGIASGSTVARAVSHPLVRAAVIAAPIMGALMDPAEGADPRKVRSATSAFDINRPGDASWWHRIASRKLDRPLDAIPVDASGQLKSTTQVNPADLEGKFLMPLPGDPTSRGRTIKSIDNIELSAPFTTHGGHGYIRETEGFANAPTIASTAANRIRKLQDQYNTDVIGAYMKMGPQSADFSSHTWAPLARMMPNAPMTKTGVADLNRAIKARLADLEGDMPKFPGVRSNRLENLLAAAPDKYRKAFITEVEQQRGKIPGVPDVVATRYATTDPALLNAPAHSSGLSMTKLTGETRSPSQHPDYRTHLGGVGHFGFGQQLPREVMWHDLVQSFDKRGKPPADWARPLAQMPPTNMPYGQLATPQWVDRTSGYMADVAKMGETAAFDKYMKQLGWRD